MSCGNQTAFFFIRYFDGDRKPIGACCMPACCFPRALADAMDRGCAPPIDREKFKRGEVMLSAKSIRIAPMMLSRVPSEFIGVPLTDEQIESVDWESLKPRT